MTTFLRLLEEKDKASALYARCAAMRQGVTDPRLFEVAPDAFDAVPGKPFAYWVSEAVRQTFRRLPAFESEGRTVKQGLATADDFRFVRGWWEVPSSPALLPQGEGSQSSSPAGRGEQRWVPFAKGGAFSPFYADVYLVVNWDKDGAEIKAGICKRYPYLNGNAEFVAKNPQFYLRPGLTWPRRTNGLSFRVMPAGCVFADKGPAAFVSCDDPNELLVLCTMLNSRDFGLLVSVQLARTELAQSYEVGVIQKTPVPELSIEQQTELATLARRAWSLKRSLDTVHETSHAFLLPAALHALTPPAIEAELIRIQAEIDAIAFDLYGFSEADREAVMSAQEAASSQTDGTAKDDDDEESDLTPTTDHSPLSTDHLISWAVGVAFGRFDWRLATGERAAPAEPEPFDPLPAKSPGMLPDGAAPFHVHAGILVDDSGHPHDLARRVEEVLTRVDAPVPEEVRRWLQRDFFGFHLQRYSKSRRKAPIYWPLSTASGRYTLWVYYPSLSNQTLFTTVNDFLDSPSGKLTQVSRECAELRVKGSSRSRDEEKQYEMLQTFEQELTDLRDTLLKIAPTYQPHPDDGVQITAAPLWPLFRHTPWQRVLRDTWAKLEKGDYDWAHLAMNYWPERVREKCKTDKSLAIAHGLEGLYVEPEVTPKKTHRKKKSEGGVNA